VYFSVASEENYLDVLFAWLDVVADPALSFHAMTRVFFSHDIFCYVC